jgi:hypothetical protein
MAVSGVQPGGCYAIMSSDNTVAIHSKPYTQDQLTCRDDAVQQQLRRRLRPV